MKDDRTNGSNVIFAVILSAIVLFSWDYFVVPKTNPALQKNITQTNVASVTNPLPQENTQNNVPLAQNQGFVMLDSVLKTQNNHRLPISTPALKGSIDLKSGRFDDLVLLRYAEKLGDEKKIRLMAPSQTDQGLIAEIGFTIDNQQTKNWKVVSGDLAQANSTVKLTASQGDIVIDREVHIDENYMFTIKDTLRNSGKKTISVTPYGLLKKNDPDFNRVAKDYVVHTGFIGRINESIEEIKFADIKEDGQYKYLTNKSWFGLTEKYWAAILIPDQREKLEVRTIYNPYAGHDGYQADYVFNKSKQLAAGESFVLENRLFAGAKSVTLIEKYGEKYNIAGLDYLVDWGWFWFFTKPIFKGLLYFYSLVGNYGIAILLLTLVIKALFFPLANKSYVAMSQMKKLQPMMEEIRKKNSDDPLKQQQELIALYKKEKINPVAGCWPMLVQIPVFFALYKVLNVALELRHQPFFGWIHDLSAPDPTNIFTLFGLLPITMPSFLHLGILPLVMGITMWLQQKLNPAPTDPIQARMMSLFPLIFTFILAGFSAGLVLYWTWNNILSIIQQALIMKRQGVPIEFHFKSSDSMSSDSSKS